MRPGGVNDVMHPEAWAEIWEKEVSWVTVSEEEGWFSELGEARWICTLRAPRVGWVERWRCKTSQHRKILCVCLSLLMSKNLLTQKGE